jgi:hypothetical protein
VGGVGGDILRDDELLLHPGLADPGRSLLGHVVVGDFCTLC